MKNLFDFDFTAPENVAVNNPVSVSAPEQAPVAEPVSPEESLNEFEKIEAGEPAIWVVEMKDLKDPCNPAVMFLADYADYQEFFREILTWENPIVWHVDNCDKEAGFDALYSKAAFDYIVERYRSQARFGNQAS